MKSLRVIRPLLSIFIFWMTAMSAGAGEVVPPLQDDVVDFSFYGLTLNVAKLNPVEVKSVFNSDVSAAWNKYKKRDVAPVLTTLGSLSSSLGLNDWFVFQLVRQYVDALLKSATPMDRMVLEHYLLMEMGYDVRLARTERQLVLLVPFKQEVYEHDFVKIEGKDYYLYFDDLDSDRDEQSVLYPCDPSKKDLGKGQAKGNPDVHLPRGLGRGLHQRQHGRLV